MRGLAAIGLVLSLACCDRVLGIDERIADAAAPIDVLDAAGLDLDMDGVLDSVDPCIQVAGDLSGDFDADGVPNSSDTCPFDVPNGSDADGDGLGDSCDPFPTATDRSRCLMRFSNPTLTTALFASRLPDLAWSTSPGTLVGDPPGAALTTATTIVSTSIEGETVTSYDIVLGLDARNRFGSLTVWVRADPQGASPADIGCRYINEAVGGPRIAIALGATLLDTKSFGIPMNVLTKLRIVARVVTTGALGASARVTCVFKSATSPWMFAEASPALPAGRFGFTVDRWLVEVGAIHVVDRAP